MNNNAEKKECIVIMPVESECEGYELGHFREVYNNLIKPSVQQAGYTPLRADEVNHFYIDHFEIVNKLVHAPMAIFDLSTADERIVTGLKIRDSFNMPFIVISDIYMPRFIKSSNIEYLVYTKNLDVPNLLYSQSILSNSIKILSGQEELHHH